MGLRLYNTLTKTKEDFVPLDPSNVRMYVCGPTVYDFAHIGNARPVIVFDVLYRLLRHLYGPDRVTYVRNITDVDDKIIERARADHPGLELNEAIAKVTGETEKQFHDDVAALGCLPPDVEPHATGHIPQMVAMIERLIAKEKAYPTDDGHVLFEVASFEDYGELARRSTDEMVAGARIEVASYKKSPMDFVLWKPSADDEPGWESPWGRGRPGWHIECSAMSAAHLGETFDIHGGGIDLVFPHHENEVAQSRCAHGAAIMAKTWMHNGFLQVEGRKMSKSEGNFVTIRDLLESRSFGSNMWHGYVLRLAMLSTHYRQPIDWTVDRLVEMRAAMRDWIDSAYGTDDPGRQPSDSVVSALSDDLNTPRLVTVLHGLCKRARERDVDAARDLNASLRFLGLWNGERSDEVYGYGYDVRTGPADVDVQPLIEARNAARAARDFAEADRIRDELADMGIQLKDGPDGTTWEIAR